MCIAWICIDRIVTLASEYTIGAAGLARRTADIGIPATKARIAIGEIAIGNKIARRAGSNGTGIEGIPRHCHGGISYGTVAQAILRCPGSGDDRAAGYRGMQRKTGIGTDCGVVTDSQRGTYLAIRSSQNDKT